MSPNATLQLSTKPTEIDWLPGNRDAEWDAFVRRHPLGMVYHLSAWKRVLQESFPHISGRVLIERNSMGEIESGLPLYTVKSWLLGNRLVSIPYATICDPLLADGQDLAPFLDYIKREQTETGSTRVEIRARCTSHQIARGSIHLNNGFRHFYIPLGRDPEALFESFSRTCVRKNIRKAQRAGIVVQECRDKETLAVCHSLLVESRRRLCLPPMPFAFFQAMKRHLWPGNMAWFLALQGGVPVGCFVLLGMNGFWVAEYSGNAGDLGSGVDQLLYWETIKWVMARGGKVYSFGRTAEANHGLMAYKRRWATSEEDLSELVFSLQGETFRQASKAEHHDRSAFYRNARRLIGLVPRPMFGAVGNFCYRHLG